MAISNPTYTKLTERGISFNVLRTNPKLTTNLKLSIDSLGKLWFNSIDATPELAQNKYKNFPISPTSNHEVNIFKFYDLGQTPSKISFAVGSTITTETIAKNLTDQFDFDLYSSGAKYLKSKQYSEKFSYLAPLYIDEVLPEAFVILKIPGASNYNIGEWQQKLADSTFNRSQFSLDFFRNAEIIKTFKLTEDTNIGKYINNIQKNPMYPKNPLYVNFKKDRYSVYRGASITSGTYVEIPELVSSTLRKAIPQLKLEQYITEGFERNNIVYPKLLNLEFLFNDDTSDEYTFNRYIGFYCNLIDITDFEIDINAMYNNIDNDNQLPFSFRKEDEVSINITNSDGVILRGIGVNTDLTGLDEAMVEANTMFFPYIKTKNSELHFPKLQTIEQVSNSIKFRLTDTKLDLGETFGPGDLYSQEEAKQSNTETRSTVLITLNSIPLHLDTIRIYHTNGSTFDRNDKYGKFDDIIFVDDDNVDDGYDSVFPNDEAYLMDYSVHSIVSFNTINPNSGTPVFSPNTPETLGIQFISSIDNSKWIWDGIEYVEEVMGSRIYVNLNNAQINNVKSTDLSELALTISTIITNLEKSYLTSKTFEENIFIQVKPTGNYYGQLAVRLLDTTSNRLTINGQNTSSTVFADGGFSKINQAIIPIGNVTRLTPILDSIVIKTEKDWSTILRVSNCSVNIENSILTQEDVDHYLNNGTLMLTDDEPIDIAYNTIEIREIFKPTFGILSIFNIKDIDFYTYTSNYSKIPEIDFYQTYWIPSGCSIIDFTKYAYTIVGKGIIEINNQQYSTEDANSRVWQNIDGLQSYSVVSGDAILIQSNTLPNNEEILRQDISILDEDQNLANFTGFFALGADHSVPDTSLPTYNYREKYKTNNLLSEYHVYLENFSKEFSNESKIVPYISKWGISNSTDARGNQYRLNSDILFGKDNFGPSHHETAPTSEKLTHEWFYIESDFNYSDCVNLLKKNYYYFDQPFDVSKMISDPTYFSTYFTYVPTYNNNEIAQPQFRYSNLILDQFTKQYSTIFNGAKFNFSEVDTLGNILPETDRFIDYSFSILLKPIKETILSTELPIKYRIIENTNAKAIVLLIELPIGHIDDVNTRLLQDTIYETLDGPVLQFPDRRLDQTNLFLDGVGSISDIGTNVFQIDWIYTTGNNVNGDNLFNTLLTSNYPSFSSIDFGNGTAINAITGKSNSLYVPTNGDTILVKKGSDINKQFIIAFQNSEIYQMAANSKLQSGARNLKSKLSQYLLLSYSKIGYLNGTTALFRIIEDSSQLQLPIQLSLENELVINRVLPGFLSMFGDYRIKFNNNNVSNLTYNFLYSAKDKKYNSTKGSYATTKLALGVDLSSSSYNSDSSNYFLTGKPLDNITLTEFKLDAFINPISGAHDTFTNDVLNSLIDPSDPIITSPLPSFSPLMFINTIGEVSLLLNSSADFTLTYPETELQLINPNLTNDAITQISENLLILNKSNTKDTIILKINVTANPTSGPLFELDKSNYPAKTPPYWLNDSTQFQLFGGKQYFANLFESLSFANFISLLEAKSHLISWESYTDGVLSPAQTINIQIEAADLVEKSTMIKLSPEIVSTESKTETGGFIHKEEPSTTYSLSRYSGEYDVLYRNLSYFKHNVNIGEYSFTGANVFMNFDIDDFLVIPEFAFIKYSEFNILSFENSDKFEPLYPMIYESPIDFDQYSVLSSSWDYQYHYNYTTKKNRTRIPGTRRLGEDYSFVSKLLNVPLSFTIESFNWVELTNKQFDISDRDFLNLKNNGALVDFAYSNYNGEVRFKINFAQVVATALSEKTNDLIPKLRDEFEKFFIDQNSQVITKDFTILGDLTFDEYLYNYCKTNLLQLYKLDQIDFYEAANRTVRNNSISIVEVPYEQLDDANYSQVKTVKINNKNSDLLVGSLLIKPSSGINLVPKLKIKYI